MDGLVEADEYGTAPESAQPTITITIEESPTHRVRAQFFTMSDYRKFQASQKKKKNSLAAESLIISPQAEGWRERVCGNQSGLHQPITTRRHLLHISLSIDFPPSN